MLLYKKRNFAIFFSMLPLWTLKSASKTLGKNEYNDCTRFSKRDCTTISLKLLKILEVIAISILYLHNSFKSQNNHLTNL